MELTTIIGIVIAVAIMLYGIKMLMKKPTETTPSLDGEIHIHSASQQPIIPRHVRDQLTHKGERTEPTLSESEEIVQVQATETIEKVVIEKTDVASKVESTTVSELAVEVINEKVKITVSPEKEKNPVEVSLDVHVEKAEIQDFVDESSILDAHLHEQKIVDEESALAIAETYLALNVYPDHSQRVLSGDKTLKVLLKYGLRYGEMQCFHRYNEEGDKLLFSVLKMNDEGIPCGFDLETLSTEEVKGLSFFLALPHADVQNAFDTMDSISRLIAREIQGTVYDQNNQEFTQQLREYWRHQAIDFRPGQQLGS